ncbi:MAG: hypothetical protein JWN62_1261 [Acidimicrobiales bacterium]|nr:hypothetical protein [Acidimicrobiales bacterium]
MSAKRALVVGVTVVVVAGAATVGIMHNRDVGAADRATAASPSPSFDLATVEKRDLTRSETFDGQVGHGTVTPLHLEGQGTITHLPSVGDVIQFGNPIAEVDGEPVLLLQGARPAWRALGPGSSAGEDIRQLETALVQMGYATTDDLTVDDTWSSETTAAVKRLQKWQGMPVDGRLDSGEFVFAPTAGRIAEVTGALGDPSANAGISTSGLDQSVEATVKSSKIDLLTVGATVEVDLPDESTVDGTVASIGAADVGQDGTATFPVEITTAALDVEDGTSVDVVLDVVSAPGAIAVPATALLALAEGGYAVEVPDVTSATGKRLVEVTVGAFADDWVQITGKVAVGDKVVVP